MKIDFVGVSETVKWNANYCWCCYSVVVDDCKNGMTLDQSLRVESRKDPIKDFVLKDQL